jgi:hypothetical protein
LLGWSQLDLVEKTKVSIISVRRFEGGHDVSDTIKDTLRVRLEKAGAVFFFAGDTLNDIEAEIGVVLRKKKAKGPSL